MGLGQIAPRGQNAPGSAGVVSGKEGRVLGDWGDRNGHAYGKLKGVGNQNVVKHGPVAHPKTMKRIPRPLLAVARDRGEDQFGFSLRL